MAYRRNTKNQANPLYRKLTRMFSGPIVNYRRQTERNMKKRQIMKHKFKTASGKEFSRKEYDPFANFRSDMLCQHSRTLRYADFEQMEFDPILASAIDIYAEEMTTASDLSEMLKIRCANPEIRDVLYQLYFNILNLEYNLFGWARSMVKYGDLFLYLDIDEDDGVKYALGLPPNEVQRMEGEDEENPNYIQYQWNEGGLTFENWQVAHFRVLGNDKYAPYGVSILDPARRIWRQLNLLEDAVMAYRIVRSPERRVFYIDVGNIAPADVEQYMQQVITQTKRNQVVDPNSGQVDLRYNPLAVEEDYYIPIRGGATATKVDPLPGGAYTGDIDDVKYLKDKLFAAIKVPQSYLFRGEGADEDKATLAQKDVMFARTIQRLQRSLITELIKIGTVHLYIKGYRGRDLVSFDLSLNNPSRIAELQELEHWRTRFDVASSATEGFFSKRWLGRKLFGLDDAEMDQIFKEMYFDKNMAKEFEAIESGEGGAFGGLGGEEGGEGEDLEDLDLGDEPEGDELPGGEDEDDVLLASPGKRSDEPRLTPGAKGKIYSPVASDKRGMGARRRSQNSQYSKESSSSTIRNIFKGKGEIDSLVRGITENKGTNYRGALREAMIRQSEQDEKLQNLIKELDELDKSEIKEINSTDAKIKGKKLKKRVLVSNKTAGDENG